MKKTLLLSLILFLASLKVFSAEPNANIPNYDSKTTTVSIPKVVVTAADGISTLYEDVELLLNPSSTWVVLKASLLDIEFTDVDLKDIPGYELATNKVYFPKVTVDNNKVPSSAELLLAATTKRWELLSFDPVEEIVDPAAPATR